MKRPATLLTGMAMIFAAGILAIFLASVEARADEVPGPSDRFVEGYISGILEGELGLGPDEYSVHSSEGSANVTIYGPDESVVGEVRDRLAAKPRLEGTSIVVGYGVAGSAKPTAGQLGGAEFCGTGGGGCWLPELDPFQPLIADPKQPRFFVSLNSYDSSVEKYTMGSVGFGETFGIYRWSTPAWFGELQGGISGALFAQFNMDAESLDLVNADYVIGFPFTWRLGRNSARLRLYHQSSHLGDEYLLRVRPQRVNLSFESVELLYSYTPGDLRFYIGGEVLLHREPSDLDRLSVHGGVEYARSEPLGWGLRPIAAADFKSFEEHDWRLDTSVKAGFAFGDNEPGRRSMRLMGRWYRGFSPYGQFYPNKVEFYGVELSLGF